MKAKCTLGNECFTLLQNILTLLFTVQCNSHTNTQSAFHKGYSGDSGTTTGGSAAYDTPCDRPHLSFYIKDLLAWTLMHMQWSLFPFLRYSEQSWKHQSRSQARTLTIVTSLDQCCFLSSGLLPVWWCELRLSSSLILLRSTWPHRDAQAVASPHWLPSAVSSVSCSQSELLVSASSPTGQPVVEWVGEGGKCFYEWKHGGEDTKNGMLTLRQSSNIYWFHPTKNKPNVLFVSSRFDVEHTENQR